MPFLLAAAAGEPNSAIAQRLQLTRATVGKWRIRFLEQRINGLYDEVRAGKPRTIDDERLAQLIHKTLHTKPADGSTHWSVRTIAAETAISATSVPRYFTVGRREIQSPRIMTRWAICSCVAVTTGTCSKNEHYAPKPSKRGKA